jgi:exopolyphosphatase / guanosine-5'-triphosphate,3'-diphosphate pyrophosphatase
VPAGEADARPIAAIDIGTNSFHLLVARPTGNNRFDVIDREKEVVRLGSGSGDMKTLAPEAVDRGIAALRRFRQIADANDAEVIAVATSAVREAENRDVFLSRAATEAGIQVEVVLGAEEARLIHLGVLQAVPVYDKRHLVIDIGGGSTEVVVGHGTDVLEARSLKLGAIRVTERFGLVDAPKRRVLDDCRQYIRSFLAPAVRAVREHGFAVAVGSSGTIVNLVEMACAARGESPAQLSGATMSRTELASLVALLAKASSVERTAIPGLDPKRADIILGGALILEQLVAELGIDELVASDSALREGVVLEALRRRNGTTLGHLADLRYESVLHLAAITPGEREHSDRATDLALQIFEQTRARHGLGAREEEVLEAAGLLANVGLFVSHDRHHLHSHYIIRNSDVLTGFTDHEVELIALVARYHRKSAPKPGHADFARLDGRDQRVVRVLAGMLRIAFALDRTRAGAVPSVRVVAAREGITLELEAAGDTSLEQYTADARKGLLEEALGCPISIVVDVDSSS